MRWTGRLEIALACGAVLIAAPVSPTVGQEPVAPPPGPPGVDTLEAEAPTPPEGVAADDPGTGAPALPPVGTVVRLRTLDGRTLTGEVRRPGSDSLFLVVGGSRMPLVLESDQLVGLEVRERLGRLSGARRWGSRGLVLGAALGSLIPLSEQIGCGCGQQEEGGPDLTTPLRFGAVGALLGAAAGLLDPGWRWRPVEPEGKR